MILSCGRCPPFESGRLRFNFVATRCLAWDTDDILNFFKPYPPLLYSGSDQGLSPALTMGTPTGECWSSVESFPSLHFPSRSRAGLLSWNGRRSQKCKHDLKGEVMLARIWEPAVLAQIFKLLRKYWIEKACHGHLKDMTSALLSIFSLVINAS